MSYHSNPLSYSRAPPKMLQIALVNAILNNKTYLLEVSYWITISELKSKIEKAFSIPVAQQRLFFQAQELNQNNFSMISFGGKKRIKIILRPTPTLENTLGLVKKYETLPKEDSIDTVLFSVQEGFNLGLIPKLTFDGTSGSYFLQNKYRKSVAIFKPFDEEPFTPNNPKDYIGKLGSPAFKPGIVSGESAVREVAAYLLDTNGFSGVPQTTFVEVVHPYFSRRDMKEIDLSKSDSTPNIQIQGFSQYTGQDKKMIIKHGSVQKFVEGAEEASDYGPKMFPDEEVRKIAMLDLRILNCDRNEGNILVKKERGIIHLIPIDHGLCFPDCFEACTYDIVWMEWPQVKKKWTPIELDYLSKINPKGDMEMLSKHFKFRDTCLRNFRIAETVLQKCAFAGMTLFEIGNLLYRDDPDFPSPVEEIIRKTEELYKAMKNSASKGLLCTLSKLNQRKGFSRGSFREEEKENESNLLNFDKRSVTRARTYSESIESNSDLYCPNVFQTILDQNNLDGNSELFTIPELADCKKKDANHGHKHSGIVATNPKASFVSKGSSKDDGSDTSSEEEEDHEEPIVHNKRERGMVRSSSIPAGLARNHGDDELVNGNADKDNNSKKSSFYPGPKAKKGLSRPAGKQVDVPQHKDELFYKYFESFLDQKIKIVMKSKQAPPTRSRFYSDI